MSSLLSQADLDYLARVRLLKGVRVTVPHSLRARASYATHYRRAYARIMAKLHGGKAVQS